MPVHGVGAPLLPKLRGHFAEFLNHSSLVRLGMLYLTTCVGLGYGPCVNSLEAFLGSIGSPNSPQPAMHHLSGLPATDLPIAFPTGLPQHYHRLVRLPSCVTPSLDYYHRRSHAAPYRHTPERAQSARFWAVSTGVSSRARTHGYGNINPLSIDYACRPRLRSRLTLGGLAWPRNPWSFGGQGSHLPYRYSCLHSHSPHLHV
jgi:hypothetical protein